MNYQRFVLILIAIGFISISCKDAKKDIDVVPETDAEEIDTLSRAVHTGVDGTLSKPEDMANPTNPEDCISFETILYKPEQTIYWPGSITEPSKPTASLPGVDSTEHQPVTGESSSETPKYVLHRLTNTRNAFNVDDNKIHLEIPISNPKLSIENVVNISDYDSDTKINAILLILKPTDNVYKKSDTEVTRLLSTDLEISEIQGLSKENLSKDNKLRVFIYHDDDITYCTIDAFKKCVMDRGYSNSNCPLNLPSGTVGAPREQGGGVIGGSGG